MFKKTKKRKAALKRIKQLQIEVSLPQDPIRYAYKTQELLFEIAGILELQLGNKI